MRGLICVGFFLFVVNIDGNAQIKCAKRNEISECVKECPPEKTCKNKDINFSCLNSRQCEMKCVCENGYFRNSIGECVSEEICDRCPGRHEYFSCGGFCDNVCSDLHTQNKTNCPVVNIVCNKKCYCDDGYARDYHNNCIPIQDCPHRCGPNEEYQKCKKTCPPDSCISMVARFKCASNPPCEPGCVCRDGFLRNDATSPCTPIHECPQLAGMPGFLTMFSFTGEREMVSCSGCT